MAPSENGYGWSEMRLGYQKGFHQATQGEGVFHVLFDFGANYYVNELLFQKEARPAYEHRMLENVKIEFKSLDDDTWH